MSNVRPHSVRQVLYTAAEHSFFDEVATVLIALSSFNAAVESFWSAGATRIPSTPDHTLYLYGRVTALAWRPNDFMHGVTRDSWPSRLHVAYLPPTSPSAQPLTNGVPFQSAGIATMVYGVVSASFVQYFEREREGVERKHGGPDNWPEVWRFGRTVRNAFAHRGAVHIRNPNSKAVQWEGVVLSPSDSGAQLLDPKRYLGVGDVPLLMEQMDEHVV